MPGWKTRKCMEMRELQFVCCLQDVLGRGATACVHKACGQGVLEAVV